jgi:hypothetical protein
MRRHRSMSNATERSQSPLVSRRRSSAAGRRAGAKLPELQARRPVRHNPPQRSSFRARRPGTRAVHSPATTETWTETRAAGKTHARSGICAGQGRTLRDSNPGWAVDPNRISRPMPVVPSGAGSYRPGLFLQVRAPSCARMSAGYRAEPACSCGPCAHQRGRWNRSSSLEIWFAAGLLTARTGPRRTALEPSTSSGDASVGCRASRLVRP